MLAGGAEVGLRLHGAARARAEELGVEVAVSLTHTRATSRAPWRCCGERRYAAARWLEPLPRRRADAGDRRLGDRRARDPVARADGASGGGARRVCRRSSRRQGTIVVVAGKGNNGGDGLVAARLLRDRGREVDVLLAGDRAELTGDARANLERLPGARGAGSAVGPLRRDAALVIDALLGTGATGEPRGEIGRGDQRDPRQRRARCSPSTFRAASTPPAARSPASAIRPAPRRPSTRAKPGLVIEPGRGHAGRVEVIDIGIPDGAPFGGDVGLIGDERARPAAAPRAGSTKFTSGRVLVAGGSRGLTGAPCLAALAAARAGAGYVTVCVPAALVGDLRDAAARGDDARAARRATAPTARRASTRRSSAAARAAARSCSGLGSAAATAPSTFVRGCVERSRRCRSCWTPTACSAVRGRAAKSCGARAAVLTPHEGELARLLGGRLGARSPQRACAAPGTPRPARAPSSCSRGMTRSSSRRTGRARSARERRRALATAGTGDVLRGVLAAMLAAGPRAVHGCCGRRPPARARRACARLAARGREGMIASDVIDALRARVTATRSAGRKRRALARVNLAAIERNCARLAATAPLLCAVVKADAYGHGAVACSRAALAGGASWLAVAAAAEAQELRDGGIDAPDSRDGGAHPRRARDCTRGRR